MTGITPVVGQILGLSIEAWIGMIIAIIAFWVLATWALFKTLRQDERKLELVDRQGKIETYSPQALQDLRDWIEANPDDPLVEEARAEYNKCVESLNEVDEPFYDWSQEKIDNLEKL
ncbi:hypothetical protein AArcSl_2129 [Halalkaliarchaeum desulfuricum]|uniref:Uncharacterized protein n=1 Tax=Halalkaliarchaeum desulfuricum TaxID=2055893 RepID=A0A343TKY2_9EURY|nr:hypothetical protein [Halalkaliarchaeum desulfuricum]AUX09754.1 hypothetical protein AArcSl_2129 [Halalkaliarchaeum desulfuricum]